MAGANQNHLVYQCIVAHAGTEPTYRTYEFPVSCTEKAFKSDVGRKLRDISPAALKAKSEVQPFTFERPRQTSLYSLNELNLIDKHRTLILGGIYGRLKTLMASDENTDIVWFPDIQERGILSEGSVLTDLDFPLGTAMDIAAFIEYEVAFLNVSPHIDVISAAKLLGMISRFVAQVLNHVEKAL